MNSQNNYTALVTGADGFIGSHLVEALVKSGVNVKAFVLYNSLGSWGWLEHVDQQVLDSIEIHCGDIRDPGSAKLAVSGCDTVFHLAALIGIPYSYTAPDSYLDTNIRGTLNLLNAARDYDVNYFINTSTSEVYGSALQVPIPETHPLQPQSPYSASKIAADQLALSYYYSFDLPVSIIRPFNTYGPRQSARAVIPTVISQIANGAQSIKLGSLYPTRDFNYVSDTVNGFVKIRETKAGIGETINIGSGYEISVQNTVELIASLMGQQITIESDDQRLRPKSSEVDRLCADNSKAKTIADWSPEHAGIDGLKRGLKKTIDWFSDPVNLSKYKSSIYNV
ncbi:MAG: NAD-dependent 4,6-dehydratase LegB [Gammaproteobacteria bacterium]|nr:NAD-dependent 4,6-dehydratase LegB [Gammaproteobacteria bacterium]MDH5801326.1 NAD-dependent 4,6-dehydratase LegB [Gammaproteobacteria bacterium]